MTLTHSKKALTHSKKGSPKAVAFLARAGVGKRIERLKAKQAFFKQGNGADSVFYLRSGRVRVTVISQRGKEATITMVSAGDFFGEEALAATPVRRVATASAITDCVALRIDKPTMMRALHEEDAFSDLFLRYLLARTMRTEANLVDQLFNSSEKRLARVLLLMANFGKNDENEALIPPITQEALAEMVGTTRVRIKFFMNGFRKQGLIDFKSRIRVKRSLLDVLLHESLPGESAEDSHRPDTRATVVRKGRDRGTGIRELGSGNSR